MFGSGLDGRTGLLRIVLRFELCFWHMTDGIEEPAIVEPTDPFERGAFRRIQRAPGTASVDHLRLEQINGGFTIALVQESPELPTDADTPASLRCSLYRTISSAPVAAVNQRFADLAGVQSQFQSIQHQISLHRSADTPAHDAAVEDIDHNGDMRESHPGVNAGKIRDSQLMGSGGDEVPMDAIQWPLGDIRGQGGALLAPTNYAAEAVAAHQPRVRAVCDRGAFATQLPPDLACPAHPEIFLPDAMDRSGELAPSGPSRRTRGCRRERSSCRVSCS